MAPNYHLEHAQTGSAEKYRLAIPGKYYAAQKVAAGATANFTGSNYGYGAVIVGNAANTADTKLHTVLGDIIDGNDLVVGTIYDIAPQKIVADTGDVFALKRLK